jgi:hypothetical protein
MGSAGAGGPTVISRDNIIFNTAGSNSKNSSLLNSPQGNNFMGSNAFAGPSNAPNGNNGAG